MKIEFDGFITEESAEDIMNKHYENCITPENPYCPSCNYGYIYNSDEDGVLDIWTCTHNNKSIYN